MLKCITVKNEVPITMSEASVISPSTVTECD